MGGDQIGPGRKEAVQRRRREAGLSCDGVDAGGADPMCIEQLLCVRSMRVLFRLSSDGVRMPDDADVPEPGRGVRQIDECAALLTPAPALARSSRLEMRHNISASGISVSIAVAMLTV
jgi:hypothetical protein